MAKGVTLLAVTAACWALSGCAANELMLKRQTEVEAKVEHLIQADKKSLKDINEQGAQVQALSDQVKAMGLQVKQLQESLLEVRGSQEDLKARLTLLAQQASSHKVEVVNPETPPAARGRETGPPAEYVKAFGLYSANNFTAAIEAFEAFVSRSPGSDYAANARYWIGECYYSLSDLPKALAHFQKVVESYPKSPKAPDALLKQGYSLSAMNQREKANAAYETLIKTYPSSPAAVRAREKLTAN